ncbi:TPA: hypothetical protein QCH88_004422, partial [Enterobacter asburiae]|nr:hypothetical protein [Enterobacter asburiae]
MAIHAKSNGLLIGGKIINETLTGWYFQALDNKGPNFVFKSDEKNKVFDGPNAVDEAIAWQTKTRAEMK